MKTANNFPNIDEMTISEIISLIEAIHEKNASFLSCIYHVLHNIFLAESFKLVTCYKGANFIYSFISPTLLVDIDFLNQTIHYRTIKN